MSSFITLTVSVSSFVQAKGVDALSTLHREGKVTEQMLKALACYLGSNGLMTLDSFIRDAFPIVDSLWEEQDGKNNWDGEGPFPELEGEIELSESVEWWLGLVSPGALLEAIKDSYYPYGFHTPNLAESIPEEQLWNYLEFLEGLKKLVDKYDVPSIEEAMLCVEDRLQRIESHKANPPTGGIIWPERFRDWN